MSHARIEEVSDSDSDPSEGDISDLDDFDDRDILQRRGPVAEHDPDRILPPKLSSATAAHPAAVPTSSQPRSAANLINPSSIPVQARGPVPDADGTTFENTTDDSKYKDYQCLYPVYFDKNRTRTQGRRVGKEMAVENPMAREIVAACGRLRLETLFEPAKFHPKDWSNPGRVKIKLKGTNHPLIQNKHHLYTLISKHLKDNPTTAASAMRVKVPGAPVPDPNKPYPAPAVPKGWKMGSILPYYSPAMTGGGVSENFLKDMMAEMQGQIPGGAPSPTIEAPAGKGKPKKPKRKIIRA
ncbi:MAG: signal recognition particle subunit [Claussenomyces sp. TS43310]|nr:MAG: signal recognition particle subunit [Claussenomyces sp. TS43310]